MKGPHTWPAGLSFCEQGAAGQGTAMCFFHFSLIVIIVIIIVIIIIIKARQVDVAGSTLKVDLKGRPGGSAPRVGLNVALTVNP